MQKRDYRSYNILEEELEQEVIEDSRQILKKEQEVRNQQAPPDKEPSINAHEELIHSSIVHKNILQEEKQIKNEVENEGALLKLEAQINTEENSPKKIQINDQEHILQEGEQVSQQADIGIENREFNMTESTQKIIEDELKPNRKEPRLFKRKKEKSKEKQSISKGLLDEEIGNQPKLDFPVYKRYYQQKERSTLFKCIMMLAKIIITLMLLPLIAVIAFVLLCIVGCFLAVILGSIGCGVIMLGSVCFVATQISDNLIALGVLIAITAMSFGGMILIIFLAITQWIRGILRRYKKPHIRNSNRGGD